MKKHVVAILTMLSEDGCAYLERQAQNIARNHGGRCGKSGVMRGVVDGLAQAGFDFSDAPTAYHIAEKIKTALGQSSEVKG